MGSKRRMPAPTGEPPLRGPRLTTAGRYCTGRQAGSRRAAPLLVCGFYVPMRSERERGLLSGASMAATVSIHRAAYYWFHSRRLTKARSIAASQFPMPAPSLGELDQPS